jgi:putative addiction module component (TIGR02574 family)
MKLEEIQASVMQLTDSQRATLAADLLSSLPGVLVDEDQGIAEARRRSRELAEDPSKGCTWEEIRQDLGR